MDEDKSPRPFRLYMGKELDVRHAVVRGGSSERLGLKKGKRGAFVGLGGGGGPDSGATWDRVKARSSRGKRRL